ncbi:MAG TPA: PHP domain-containing protein [Nitrosopumilaceae archaeon]|jgi:putative hydrolase|nr:PHP domain-containing protein [Nitrosopumilaceae archaeon]
MTSLPKLNTKEDYHIHSNFNDHSPSNLSIKNIVKRMEKINLDKIAITEHIRKSSDWIEDYLNQIETYGNKKIITGFEAKILPDGTPNCLNKYQKNYFIIASFHNLFHDKKKWLQALERIICNSNVDVIGHLGPWHDEDIKITEDEINYLSHLIVDQEKIIEINAKYEWPKKSWIKIFKKNGVKFHLGSDAHKLEDIGQFDRISDLINIVNR